ncbi:MAG: sulfotransferase [Bacteriovoracaceae bacterium]
MPLKPNFLYIGAARSGSTYLYKILRTHKDVFIPTAKEINFFSNDENFKKGLNWYLQFFLTDKKVIGEIDHDYFLNHQSAMRIKSMFPEIKIICSLREPIAKTYSQFHFWRGTKIDPNLPFMDYALKEKTVNQADYYNLLKPYFELFPKEQILVIFFDELISSPQLYLSKVLNFLNIENSIEAKIASEVVNPLREPRFMVFLKLCYTIYLILKKYKLLNLSGKLKYNFLLNKLIFKNSYNLQYPQLTKDEWEILKIHYHKNFKNLEVLIGQTLPKKWS